MNKNKNKTATKKQRHVIDKIVISILRIIVIVIICMQIVIPLIISYANIYRPRRGFNQTPDNYGLKYDSVEYKTDDGIDLKGWFIESQTDKKSPGVLLVHGIGTNRSDLLDIGNLFFKNGYSVLLFDLRSHGLSDGKKVTFGFKEIMDVEASLKFLSQQKNVDENKLGIYAISLGASVSLLSAGQSEFTNNYAQALILDSPYARLSDMLKHQFPLHKGYVTPIPVFVAKWFSKVLIGSDIFAIEPIDVMRKLEKPVLFIHGAEDMMIPKEQSRELYDEKIFGKKDLWMVPLTHHLEGHKNMTKEYEKRIVEFFDQYLKVNP